MQTKDKNGDLITLAMLPKYVVDYALKNMDERVKGGANINVRDHQGWTPLMHAVERGNIELVKGLLRMDGIKVNEESNLGWSALLRAGYHRNKEMAELLLENGAQINDGRVRSSMFLGAVAEIYKEMMRT